MKPINITDNSFQEEVINSLKPSFVQFWAEWCGPCRAINPVIEELALEYKNIKFCKVNVDENPKLVVTYGITSIPAMFFIQKKQVVDKQIGAVPKSVLDKKIYPLIEYFEEEIKKNIEFVGITEVDGKLRLISCSSDGEIKFLDSQSKLYNILYTQCFESSQMKALIKEFEFLINNSSTKESDLQDFFIRNPDFIINDDYKKAHSHLILNHNVENTLIPDFVLEPIQENALADLLELKMPSSKVYVLKKNRLHFSSAIIEAAAQLRTYSEYFDRQENRTHVLNKYGLNIFKPRMILIIGRKGTLDSINMRRIESDLPHLTVKTYDDILIRMRNKFR